MKYFTHHPSCKGKVLSSVYTYRDIERVSQIECVPLCTEDACKSFQYDRIDRPCHLNSVADTGSCSMMTNSPHMTYFHKKPICLNGGVLLPGETCACVGGYVGEMCERLLTDCTEGYKSGHGYPNGIYNIQPHGSSTPFPVYCRMQWGGRTRIMYRYKNNLDFYRKWSDYRNGFGNVTDDHCLGLEKIHQLTKSGRSILKVLLSSKNSAIFYQQIYNGFAIGSEADKYRMIFIKTEADPSRKLGDCLTPLNGSSFSTYDHDNDNFSGSCAVSYKSGWWFNACADCNPNGRLLQPVDGLRTNVTDEVFWTNDLENRVPKTLKMWIVKE